MNDFKLENIDFTRQAPLFSNSSFFHTSSFKESVEFNLSKILPQLGNRPVGGAAFSAALYKISPVFFQALTWSIQLTEQPYATGEINKGCPF